MEHKKYIRAFLFLTISAIVLAFACNMFLDPRWVSISANSFNFKRPVFDERMQKTNFLIYAHPSFENIVLGSSRSSYLPTKILGKNWLNYATSGMYPDEYFGYLKIAEAFAKDKKIDTVLIGLDFWATCKCAIVPYKSAEYIKLEASSLFKVTTNYLTFDALHESLQTFLLNKFPKPNTAFYILPSLEKNRTQTSQENYTKIIKEQLWYYETKVFDNNIYNYSEDYLVPLKALIDSFPETKFIFYTSPVSTKLDNLKTRLGREEDEKHWQNELKTLNAKVIITNKTDFTDSMFFDSHHLKPSFFPLIFKSEFQKKSLTFQRGI